MPKNIKKIVENWWLNIEKSQAFEPSWWGVFVNPFYIARTNILQSVIKFSKTINLENKTILDVGCGIKPYASFFSKHKYIGIDVKGGGHQDEAKNVDQFFDGINIPFPDSYFDIIISSQVFEHVEHLDELLNEISRVLKQNGKMFITMPFVWPEHELPFDFRRFTKNGHIQILTKHGFKNIQIESTCGVFGTCGQLLSDFFINLADLQLQKFTSEGINYKIKFVVKRLTVILICFPIQLLFNILDKIFDKKGITLDYTITCFKK